MKKIFVLTVLTSLITFNNSFSAALSGGSSSPSSGESTTKNLSDSVYGLGLSFGARFNLIKGIISDSEDKESSFKDNLFSEPELFYNNYFSGDIDRDYGARVNFGYEISGFRIYGSGGYLQSNFSYQEQGTRKQSVRSTSPFWGGGIGYDLTKNISLRINSTFYRAKFTPKYSGFDKTKVDVSSVVFGIAYHF